MSRLYCSRARFSALVLNLILRLCLPIVSEMNIHRHWMKLDSSHHNAESSNQADELFSPPSVMRTTLALSSTPASAMRAEALNLKAQRIGVVMRGGAPEDFRGQVIARLLKQSVEGFSSQPPRPQESAKADAKIRKPKLKDQG